MSTHFAAKASKMYLRAVVSTEESAEITGQSILIIGSKLDDAFLHHNVAVDVESQCKKERP